VRGGEERSDSKRVTPPSVTTPSYITNNLPFVPSLLVYRSYFVNSERFGVNCNSPCPAGSEGLCPPSTTSFALFGLDMLTFAATGAPCKACSSLPTCYTKYDANGNENESTNYPAGVQTWLQPKNIYSVPFTRQADQANNKCSPCQAGTSPVNGLCQACDAGKHKSDETLFETAPVCYLCTGVRYTPNSGATQ